MSGFGISAAIIKEKGRAGPSKFSNPNSNVYGDMLSKCCTLKIYFKGHTVK